MNYQELRRARKAAKKTQEDLAAHLGVNRATISKYETGIIEPSLSQLKRIALFLDADFYELMDEDISTAYDAGYDDGVGVGIHMEQYDNDRRNEKRLEALKRIGYTYTGNEIKLITAFSRLNEEGQQKTIERVEELTEIPKYQKSITKE